MLTTKRRVLNQIQQEIDFYKTWLDDRCSDVSMTDPCYELVSNQRHDLEARISALEVLKMHLK